jgi:hypothetical protein
MRSHADPPPLPERAGCRGLLWVFVKMPFMILRVVPHTGALLRREAATDSGQRARTLEELTPAGDQAAVTAALAQVRSHDAGFDLAATARAVVRARQVVDQARQAGDASIARPVLSDGLWRVLVLLLDARAAHRVIRQGTSAVVGADVVAAVRDQLAEQLRIRLACRGERYEVADGVVLRGQPGQTDWSEDWIIRRSADAATPPGGGVLSGLCPQCGAPLQVDEDGSCMYCRALVSSGGLDWVVWSIEEAPW